VTVRRVRSVEGTRHVRADSCADVADALSLVVALAVDPAALTAPSAARALAGDAAAPTLPAPTEPSEPTEPSRGTSPVPTVPVPPAPQKSAPHAGDRPEEPAPRFATRSLSLGTDLAFATGTAPNALVGVSPHIGWTSHAEAAAVFSARLGFLRATSGAVDVPGGSASFAWTVGRADACATGWPTKPARVSACARVEAGELVVTGLHVPAPRTQGRGWVAAGPLLRGEWLFAPPLFVDAEISAMVHVTADRFYFLPDTTAYRTPPSGIAGSVGVGVSFL
jgi:hypothetical protein